MSLLDVAIRGARGVSLDWVAAMLAALATGAAVFLMPTAILEAAVLASGMAETFAPLQPPLGWKARLGLALMSSGSAFGMVLLLMRLAVRAPAQRTEPTGTKDEPAAPKVRRRDRHPDAPTRPPLSVSRDLGIGVDDDQEPAEAPVLRRSGREAPERAPTIRREPQDPIRAAAPWLRKSAEEETAPLPRLLRVQRAAGWTEPEEPAEAEAETPAEAHPPEGLGEPELLLAEPEAAEAPEPEPAPAPVADAPAAHAPQPPAWLDEPHPQPRPEGSGDETIAELVARFERAMARRAVAPRRSEAQGTSVRGEEDADRLRSALESLRRFAPGQG